MDPIESAILENWKDGDVTFVFPSDIAANLWLQKALAITGARTLPTERFIAWDRFKESAVQASVAGKSPVSAAIRKMYALNLASRNANSRQPLVTDVIPLAHSASGGVFAPWIARILPQLALWNRKLNKSRSGARSAEESDLLFIYQDYSSFLERNALFEPAWQRPPLKDTGKKYVVFYVELIEDWDDYAELVRGSPCVRDVPVSDALAAGQPSVSVYADAREEYAAVALEIGKLIDAGAEPEEIALSVPDLETARPYILRELSLRGIPYELRAGDALAAHPACRVFSLLQDCAQSDFAFASVKALLLDRLLPWKSPELAEALVEFGVRNHCVVSWAENGKKIDIWEEAFKAPSKGEASDWRVRDFYRALRESILPIARAREFKDIRNAWFSFRESFLDVDALSEGDNAVIARAISELTALAALAARFPDCAPESPYSFFVSTLAEKKYVPQRTPGGIGVFPYRVAAGTPFIYHFIIDASQDSVTVLYRQLAFLRHDRRLGMGLSDVDASDSFLGAYRALGGRFSCSEKTFAGYRMPHVYFTVTESASADRTRDAHALERAWAARGKNSASGADFPDALNPLQKNGFRAWAKLDAPRGFSYLAGPFDSPFPFLDKLAQKTQMDGDDVRVSQSDLVPYSVCPARWFLGKVLGIKAQVSDASLMDERNLGLLYHAVLKEMFEYVLKTGPAFSKARMPEYRETALALARGAAAGYAEFQGPLAKPIIDSYARKIAEGVCGMLEADARYLDGFIPEFLEKDLAFSLDGIRYYGKIDRVSRRPSDGERVIIDYKSGKVPTASSYRVGEGDTPADGDSDDKGESAIKDFQMAAYVFLAEQSPESPYKGKTIEHAWFGNLKEGNFQPIVEDKTLLEGSRAKCLTRGEFEPAMRSFGSMAARFAASVRAMDFRKPSGLPRSECAECDFGALCRQTYSVRP